MEKYFFCSLIHNGVLGGGLILNDDCLIYRTSKTTADSKYRKLIIPIHEIRDIFWKGLIVSITMKNEESYRFLVFNKRKFIRNIKSK